MIITELTGGLGNQMFQYAAGLQLAKKLNSRLYLRTNYLEKNDKLRNLHLDKFTIDAKIINEFAYRLIRSRYLRMMNRLVPINLHFEEIIDDVENGRDLTNVYGNAYLFGYWGLYVNYKNILPLMRKHLKLKKKYHSKIFKDAINFIKNKSCVAVHIRRTDYLNETNKLIFKSLPHEYYEKSLAYIKNKINDIQLLIFTDDIKWVKQNFQLNIPINYASDFHLSDYEEFELMRNCTSIIIANSTFSWWASALNYNEKCNRIQPRIWYNNESLQQLYDMNKILFLNDIVKI